MPKRPASEDPVAAYVQEIQRNLSSGIASEHTHRPALKNLLERLDPSVSAFNDPKHIEVGAPDFTIRRKGQATDFPVGWAETKDVGEDLNKTEKSEQLERYLGLPNLILTDYVEFRWFADGKRRLVARLGVLGRRGKIALDSEGSAAVRELLEGFLRHSIETVATPKELAVRMAGLAHVIRDILLQTFEAEREKGKLHGQFQAFQGTLIPDLKPGVFADMYAQTIAYGLFAARCQPGASAKTFSRGSAADLIPKTNPFLRKLFQEIAFELDDRVLPFVDDLVALLRGADIGKIMEDFGKRTAREDPVVHFYEDFLKEYDPKIREMRGVYYTPEPVVSYIVRSVDHLLKTRFDKPMGLADKDVLILDPACGTGTFLYYVIRHIHDTLVTFGQKAQWSGYVSENLLKRVFGFELLMAPYAVAHLKLGLLLQELGYKFETDERLGVYLTNTLEEAIKRSEAMFAKWISDEANAAAEIKRDKPIMVVLGNPPYSGISANRGKWITKLLEEYRRVDGKPLGEKKVWLADDYVKFLRFGQWRIERTGEGILAFVTNHGYVDNPTFRGMRQSFLKSFNGISVLNLHGNTKKRETSPTGQPDANVFDIQQGVAIGIFMKSLEAPKSLDIQSYDLWGNREQKYDWLKEMNLQTTPWKNTRPNKPYYFFSPSIKVGGRDYQQWPEIRDALPANVTGIVTARDALVIGFDKRSVLSRISQFLDENQSDKDVTSQLNLVENYQWRVHNARIELRNAVKGRNLEEFIKRMLYRPFDARYIFYHASVVWRPRPEIMLHMLGGPNIALLTTRQTKDKWDAFVTRDLVGHKSLSAYDITSAFPLNFYEQVKPGLTKGLFETPGRRFNIGKEFAHNLQRLLGLRCVAESRGDLKATLGSEDLLSYIYATFSSPRFRDTYAQALRVDFPRIPITKDKGLFRALTQKGHELVALHLMESPKLNPTGFLTRWEQPGDNAVDKVRYVGPNPNAGIKSGRVYINAKQFFEGVPKDLWEFHIGGYQVCEKWLKDRKGRKLSSDEIDHYQKIVVALSETIRLMKEIDEIIPGWPLP